MFSIRGTTKVAIDNLVQNVDDTRVELWSPLPASVHLPLLELLIVKFDGP